jgi:hypothetical protein
LEWRLIALADLTRNSKTERFPKLGCAFTTGTGAPVAGMGVKLNAHANSG